MNGSTARELRRLARNLGWTKGQYRAAKRKLNATPRDRRGAALSDLRDWNAAQADFRARVRSELEREAKTEKQRV